MQTEPSGWDEWSVGFPYLTLELASCLIYAQTKGLHWLIGAAFSTSSFA